MVTVFVLVFVFVLVLPLLILSDPLLLFISLPVLAELLFALLLPLPELSVLVAVVVLLPDVVLLPEALELELLLILAPVVSGVAARVAWLFADILEEDESVLEVELVVLLPHDAMNKPKVRLSMLIFKIFIRWFF